MQCPYCKRTNTRVVQTFLAQDAFGEFVRRRRACSDCSFRWWTRERAE